MTTTNQPRPRRFGAGFWVLLAVAVIGVGAFAFRVYGAMQERSAQGNVPVAPPPLVAVESPVVREMVDGVSLTGTIRPRREIDVFARLPGRVERLPVKLGDRVKTGQVLAVIEHRELEWQARLADAQVLIADANLELAQNGLDAATKQFERLQVLSKGQAASTMDMERAEIGAKSAQTTVKLASAQRDLSRAQAGLAATAFDNCKVTSPIDGIVVQRLIREGSQASPAMPLFKVLDSSQLVLEGSVSGAEFARLQVGHEALVQVDDLGGEPVKGTLTAATPMLDPVSRRAFIEITVDNERGQLLANMFARATIEIGHREKVLSVAEKALITDSLGPLLYVVRDGKAQQVRPKIGVNDGKFVSVRSGLTEKDLVVVSGQSGLLAGAPVRVSP